MPAIKALTEAANQNGWYVYGVTASDFGKADELRHQHQLPFDFVQCDEKTIKTAIRSNPGVMLLQQGAVRGLWHCNDVPAFERAAALLR